MKRSAKPADPIRLVTIAFICSSSRRGNSLFDSGALPTCGSIWQHGALLCSDWLICFGTLQEDGSLSLHGTIFCYGSFYERGALCSCDSLPRYGALRLPGFNALSRRTCSGYPVGNTPGTSSIVRAFCLVTPEFRCSPIRRFSRSSRCSLAQRIPPWTRHSRSRRVAQNERCSPRHRLGPVFRHSPVLRLRSLDSVRSAQQARSHGTVLSL